MAGIQYGTAAGSDNKDFFIDATESLPDPKTFGKGTLQRGLEFYTCDGTSFKQSGDIQQQGGNWQPIVSLDATAEEALMVFELPAGTLKPSDILKLKFKLLKSGAVVSTLYNVRLGSSSAGLTNTIVAQYGPVTTARQLATNIELLVASDTTVARTTIDNAAIPFGTVTVAGAANVTVPDINANNLYLSITKTAGATGETSTLVFSKLHKEDFFLT